MNNIHSLSPKIQIRSTPKIGDFLTRSTGKLPYIRERAFTNHKIRNDGSYNDSKEEEIKAKMQQKLINFFDLKSPVNENKLAIVKAGLKNRNTTTQSPIYASLKTEETNRKEVESLKNELDLHIKFLKDKESLKRPQEAADQKNPTNETAEVDRVIEQEFRKKNKELEICPAGSVFVFSARETEKISETKKKNSDVSSNPEEGPKGESASVSQESEKKFRSLAEKNEALEQELDEIYKENSQIKRVAIGLSEEIAKLKEENLSLCEKINESTEREQNLKSLLEIQIKDLTEDMELKDHDFEVLKDQLKRSENNRKKYLESTKDLETEFTLAKKKIENLNKLNQDLQSSLQKTSNELSVEKEKTYLMESLKEEIDSLKYELRLTRDENKEAKVSKDIAKESLETVRKNFDCSRVAWKEKENHYEKMVENLMEQLHQEKAKNNKQVAETAKLKKALTLRDNDSFNTLQKEESSRYLQKIMQLDRENLEFIEENEKLRKNIEYFEFLVKNKEEIIMKLNEESQLNQEINCLFTSENLRKLKDFVSKWMICQKCNRENAMHVLSPCQHLLCSQCNDYTERCPKCLLSPSVLRSFADVKKIRDVYAILSSISIE